MLSCSLPNSLYSSLLFALLFFSSLFFSLTHSLLVAVLGLSRHNPQRFDRVSNWVVSCLLHSTELAARITLLSNFIRLLEHLISINNFTSSMAILSALNSACIQRLKSTWKVSLSLSLTHSCFSLFCLDL